MEIKIMFPRGGYFELKWEPLDWDRFCAICWLIGIFIAGSGVLRFFELAKR